MVKSIINEIKEKIDLRRIKKENKPLLYFVEDRLRAKKSYALDSVKLDGLSLSCASVELRNDKDVVLAAVKQNGLALQYASKELKNDLSLSLVALNENVQAINYVGEELKTSRESLLELEKVLNKDKKIDNKTGVQNVLIKSRLYEFKKKRNLINFKKSKWSFHFATEEMKNDKRFMLAAVKISGKALGYASDKLKNDKDVVIAAIREDESSVFFASKELKESKEFLYEIKDLLIRNKNSFPNEYNLLLNYEREDELNGKLMTFIEKRPIKKPRGKV